MYIDAFDSMGPDSASNRLPETRTAGAPAESREIVDVVVEYRSDHRRVLRSKIVVRRKKMDWFQFGVADRLV